MRPDSINHENFGRAVTWPECGESMRTCAVIAAAGMSSRMGDFKPKIELNGFPMIEMTVQSAKNGGVEKVFVIAGNRIEQIDEVLKGSGAEIVQNPLFDTQDMFSSVRMGIIKAACGYDALFVLPGDIPLVGPKVFGALERVALSSKEDVFIPKYEGNSGHPVLIKKEAFSALISYSGNEGLRGAMKEIPKKYIDAEDLGVLADADTPFDMEELKLLAKRRKGIAPKLWEALYDEAGLPQHIRAHCRAVGALSAEIAENLIRAGYRLDVELCRSGGAMHDILRLEKYHPLAGARFLRDRGYWAVSSIIAAHNDFEGIDFPDFDEGTVVCLADKLIKDDTRVTLITRYFQAREAFAPDTDIGLRVRQDEEKCRLLVQKYRALTGIELE